jgi:predicted RNA-binding Zn-ribbon protein involved in translation (DUF1610 family)
MPERVVFRREATLGFLKSKQIRARFGHEQTPVCVRGRHQRRRTTRSAHVSGTTKGLVPVGPVRCGSLWRVTLIEGLRGRGTPWLGSWHVPFPVVEQPGANVRQKAGLNRAILAQGWGLLRRRTEQKAPGRVEDVSAPFTSLRCSACGWIEKKSRKSRADFVCVSCGFTCNADENASINVAAGQGGIPRPRQAAGAGGVTAAVGRSSAREPQPARVGIPLHREGEEANGSG